MIFRKLLGSSLAAGIKRSLTSARHLHEVHHSREGNIFYVALRDLDKKAVLHYKIDGKVMDLRAINVPKKFGGQGIARLLTETAFTYAIVHDYFLFLTCRYTQKYYLANKNTELRKRVVGPKSVLSNSNMLDPETFEMLPDPEEGIPEDCMSHTKNH